MALKFRLRGLAETFIEHISCPSCGAQGSDDADFETEHTRVTFEGIIVVVECRTCGELFVPQEQRFGVINPLELRKAVEKDSEESGAPLLSGLEQVKLCVERMNDERRGTELN